MNRTITVNFKDGNKITVEPKQYDFGLFDLGNEITFNAVSGTLYKIKENILCGEDITDTVDTIEIVMKY